MAAAANGMVSGMNGGVPRSGNFRGDSPASSRIGPSQTSQSIPMRCHRLPTLKLLTIAILAMLPAASAFAGPQQLRDLDAQNQQSDDKGQSRRDSLSDAVRRVERNTRGEVLSAERVQYDGRDMHRVKVVDDQGRVRVFMQDPQRRDDAPARGDSDSRAARRQPAPTRDDDD